MSCYRQYCGMWGGVFVVCKVFGRGRDLKHCWATSELQVPPPALKLSLCSLSLKGTVTSQCLLGLWCLISLLASSLSFLSLLMKLMLTHRLRTHTLAGVKVATWLHWWYLTLICVTQVHVWFSEVSWRATWECFSWASGWDEVSEKFVLKA